MKIVTADAGTVRRFAARAAVSCSRCTQRVHARGRRAEWCGHRGGILPYDARPHAPPEKSFLLPLLALALALPLAACGEQKIEVASSSPQRAGAELFQQRCAGCHTFSAAATQGSSADVRTRERTDGPNFNTPSRVHRARPLRDPERRLLRRDHAAEHRRRRAGAERSPSSSRATPASDAKVRGRTAAAARRTASDAPARATSARTNAATPTSPTGADAD